MAGQQQKQQHVDIHRKLSIRKPLLEHAASTGAFFVPFIGDGDIAVELYKDRQVYGADLDKKRVAKAKRRLPGATIVPADCDSWPFPGLEEPFALADFDAYSYPYDSFRAFWANAQVESPLVLFFTDAQRQAMERTYHYRSPDGQKVAIERDINRMREVYNFYWLRTVLPWFEEFIKPWRIVTSKKYLRGGILYWGVVIERAAPEKPKKAGRKEPKRENRKKFDATKKEEFLQLLREGKRRSTAARAVGVVPETVSRHAKRYPAFADAMSRAETEADDQVEDALFEAARSGNVTAQQVWLYNRRPERWSDRRNLRLTGEKGGPIQVEQNVKVFGPEDLQPALEALLTSGAIHVNPDKG